MKLSRRGFLGGLLAAAAAGPALAREGAVNLFRRVPGFHKVATYVGNGAAEREVKWSLGMKPKFLIIKRRAGEDWLVLDAQRDAKLKDYLDFTPEGAHDVDGPPPREARRA